MIRKAMLLGFLNSAGWFGSAVYAQAADPASGAVGHAAMPPLSAAAPAEGAGSDIVVTALRRETRLQTTPAAVTAIGGSELAARGITDVQNLAIAVPGLSFGENLGQAHIAIRGIGADSVTTGQDPRVAFYQDNVYIARPSSQLGGFFDLERVEVLKGPQGALYGRNATGGAISVVSRAPSQTVNGYINVGYGNYDDKLIEAAFGSPLSTTLAFRAAFRFNDRGGYGKNLLLNEDIDNKHEYAGRLSLLWTPASRLSFATVGDYSRENDQAFGLHLLGGGNPALAPFALSHGGSALLNSRDVINNVEPEARVKIYGIRETASLDLDFATIKSITAYRYSNTSYTTDLDGTNLPLAYNNIQERSRQFSEEAQVSGEVGHFSWLVGMLYFHEHDRANTIFPFNSLLIGGANSVQQGFYTGGLLLTNSLAPYAKLDYKITPKLNLSVGGRYTYEHKSVNDTMQLDFSRPYNPNNPIIPVPPFPRQASISYKNFIPSATLDYKFSSSIFAYFTYSQGFKSGGFGIGVNNPPFAPEKIKNYEFGLKTASLNGKLRANLTLFHYDYSDLQVSLVRGSQAIIENAATARINGVEFETTIGSFSGFSFNGSVTYLGSRYNDYVSTNPIFVAAGPQNLAGNELTQSPKFSFNLSGQKDWRTAIGKLTARVEYSHVSRVYFTPFDQLNVSQSGYGLLGGSLRLGFGKSWSAEAYIRNATNKLAVSQSFVATALLSFPNVGVYIPPRTYGIKVGYAF